MNHRVRVLIEKEWSELVKRPALVWTLAGLPLLFLGMALVLGLAASAFPGIDPVQDAQLDQITDQMVRQQPHLANLERKALVQLVLLQQFLLLFLVVPVVGSTSIAAYSIVGEKVARSLEPLLATPITTAELILGKTLAAVIPALATAWATFALFVAGVAAMAESGVFAEVFNLNAVLIIVLLPPLVGVLGVGCGVIASARASDPRSAQQVAALIILPLVALLVSQLSGLFHLTPARLLAGSAVLALIDAGVLRIGVGLFQREKILTNWK